MTIQQVQDILSGDIAFLKESDDPLFRSFYMELSSGLLRPKTIVQYKRVPFVYPVSNVRITVDSELRACPAPAHFLDEKAPMARVMDDAGVLEVKWDAFCPEFILDLVQMDNRRTCSASKYAMCRQYW